MHQPFLLQRASVLSSEVDASHQLLSVQVVPPHTHSLGFFVLPFVDGPVGGSEEPPPPPLLFKLLLTAGTGDGGGDAVVHLVPEVNAVLQWLGVLLHTSPPQSHTFCFSDPSFGPAHAGVAAGEGPTTWPDAS
jgi:hypothetical protein